MLKSRNLYCSNCIKTEKFLVLEDRYICQVCCKILWEVPRVKDGTK